MPNYLLTSNQDQIVSIQFNRPEKKNALTRSMYTEAAAAIAQADADPSVRVILITGGESAFTSGNDIQDFLQAASLPVDSPPIQFLVAISTAKKPIVAAVNGVAIGIGTTMLLHCDLVYAGQGARFHLPFVNLGLVPEGGSSLILPQMLGQRRAAELLLLAEPFDAPTAQQLGIVNKVVADGDVQTIALQAARQLAAKAPSALQLSKQLLKQHNSEAVQRAIATEGKLFGERLTSPEAMEALQAFLEKRKPDFSKF